MHKRKAYLPSATLGKEQSLHILLFFRKELLELQECSGVFGELHGKTWVGASLVAQWLRICLPMQGTRVRALVWEDPTCRGAAKPVSHNY